MQKNSNCIEKWLIKINSLMFNQYINIKEFEIDLLHKTVQKTSEIFKTNFCKNLFSTFSFGKTTPLTLMFYYIVRI